MGYFLLFLLFFSLYPTDAFSADTSVGVAAYVRGDVSVRRSELAEPLKLRKGDQVGVGQIISTGSGSAVQLLLSDQSIIMVSANSAVRVNQYAFDKEEDRRTLKARVIKGRVRFIVNAQRKSGSGCSIETETALIDFGRADVVISNVKKETEVAVLSGSVSARNSSNLIVGTVAVGDGQITLIKEKSPPSALFVLSGSQRRMYSSDAEHF